jgi:hypothetical protein
VKAWLTAGLILGAAMVVMMHDTKPLRKVLGSYYKVRFDPLNRVRQWKEVAAIAGSARQELEAEGKPAFIIAGHYGLVSEITFYLPEAKTAVTGDRMVFFRSQTIPKNQYFFWPGYTNRTGQSAVFVVELDLKRPEPKGVPPVLLEEFGSVTPLGIHEVKYYGQVSRTLQLFACRNLK